MKDANQDKVVSIAGARGNKEKSKEEPVVENNDPQSRPVFCSFCKRSNKEVIKMIKGPDVNICSECTMICIQYFMLEDRVPQEDVKLILESFWNMAR